MKLAIITTVGVGLLTAGVVASLWIPTSLRVSDALVESREQQMMSTSIEVAQQVRDYFKQASVMNAVLERYWLQVLEAAPSAPMQYLIKTYGFAMYNYLREHPALNSCYMVVERNPQYVNSPCDVDGWLFSTSYLSEMLNTTTGANFPTCPKGSTQSCSNRVRLAAIAGEKNTVAPTTVVGTIFDAPCTSWMLGSTYSMLNGNLTRQSTPSYHGVTRSTWAWSYPDVAGAYPRQSILHAPWQPLKFPSWPMSPQGVAFVQCSIRLSYISVNNERSVTVSRVLESAAAAVGLRAMLLVWSFKREVIATSIPGFQPERVLGSGLITGLKTFHNETLPDAVRKVGQLVEEKSCWATPCDFDMLPPITRHAGHTVAFVQIHDPLSTELGLLLVMMVPISEIEGPANELERELAIISSVVFVCACLLALVFGAVIGHPIGQFQSALIEAASLRNLESFAEPRSSIVTEIDVMQGALRVLVEALMEYRGYLPAAMHEQEEEEAISHADLTTCEARSPSNSSSGDGRQTVVKVTGLGLGQKHVSVMCVNVREWSARTKMCDVDEVNEKLTKFLVLLKLLIERGTVERFNGDRFLVSWNSQTVCRDRQEMSAQAASNLAMHLTNTQHELQDLFPPGQVGIGLCSGNVICGNVGTDFVRAHNVFGAPVSAAHALCQLSSACATESPIVLCDSSAQKLSRTSSVAVGIWTKLSHRQDRIVYEVLDAVASTGEWMYDLQVDTTFQDSFLALVTRYALPDKMKYADDNDNIFTDIYTSVSSVKCISRSSKRFNVIVAALSDEQVLERVLMFQDLNASM